MRRTALMMTVASLLTLPCLSVAAKDIHPTAGISGPKAPIANGAEQEQGNPGEKAYAQAFAQYFRQFELIADPVRVPGFKARWEHKFDGKIHSPEDFHKAERQLFQAAHTELCPKNFDGACLYRTAFRAYLNLHKELASKENQAKFASLWEHRFDKSDEMKTLAGTLSAIRRMRDGIGLRFDFVNGPAQSKQEQERETGFAGISIPVMLRFGELKIDPEHGHDLAFSSVPKRSPLFGKVAFGDRIEAINGVATKGLPLKEAHEKLEGKEGDKITLILSRLNDKGEREQFSVDTTLTIVPDALTGLTPSVATLDAPFDMAHMDEVLIGPNNWVIAGEPSPDSPAKGKVKGGDSITAVNGDSLAGMTLADSVKKIRGPAGTSVTLTIERNGEKPFDVTLKRFAVQRHAVHSIDLPDGNTLIILDDFLADTVVEEMGNALTLHLLKSALAVVNGIPDGPEKAITKDQLEGVSKILKDGTPLTEEGYKHLIETVKNAQEIVDSDPAKVGGVAIDVTHNPGGNVKSVKDILSMILPSGMIYAEVKREPGTSKAVVTEYILGPTFETRTQRYQDGDGKGKIENGPRGQLILPASIPLIIIQGEQSASGAEMLAGSCQKNQRCTVIAGDSVGKSEGQNVVFLSYGVNLHVTSFEFFPGGARTNLVGVITNIPVPLQIMSEFNGSPVTATNNPRVAAAVAEIKRQKAVVAERNERAKATFEKHKLFFQGMIDARDENDKLPAAKQDPSLQK